MSKKTKALWGVFLFFCFFFFFFRLRAALVNFFGCWMKKAAGGQACEKANFKKQDRVSW